MSEELIKYALFTVNKQSLYNQHEAALTEAFNKNKARIYSKFQSPSNIRTLDLTHNSNNEGWYLEPANFIAWLDPQPTETKEENGLRYYKFNSRQNVVYIYASENMDALYAMAVCTTFLLDIAIHLGLLPQEVQILESKLQRQEFDLRNSVARAKRIAQI
jgi:hypothetical protein